MASLQKKNESWHCQFLHYGKRHTWVIGKVEELDAQASRQRVEYLLRLIRHRVLAVPSGMDILEFLRRDGKPAENKSASSPKRIERCRTARFLSRDHCQRNGGAKHAGHLPAAPIAFCNFARRRLPHARLNHAGPSKAH